MDASITCRGFNEESQEALVKTHAVLVKRIAHHLLGHLPYSVQLDDLIQAGMLGLLEAARHYDASKGASFETYAGIRVRGFMLDEVRRNDWIPRSVYRNARIIADAVRTVENRLGRDAKDYEVAAELAISLDEYYIMRKDSVSSQFYGFDDLGVSDDILKAEGEEFGEPHINALRDDMIRYLTHIIESLPENERLVLSLYYDHDFNLKEIGEVLGVSESRVSQIHSQATSRIKSRMLSEQ